MRKIISTNPGKNYEKIGEVMMSSKKEIHGKVEAARRARRGWKELGVAKRIKYLRRIDQGLVNHRAELISLSTKEMGKPIRESRAEFEETRKDIKWYFDNGERCLRDEVVYKQGKYENKIVYEPWGVAAVITPWNFPLEMPMWGIIPNLVAGNTVVMKHSEECALMGKLLDKIIAKAGLPKGVFSQIYGDGQIGEQLVRENIDLLWFTGSSKVGKHLYELCGQKFIKSIMELGGSSPGIVFKDADIDGIINQIYNKRFGNMGQRCSGLKRLIVEDSVFNQVIEKLTTVIKTKIVGDPAEETTDLGCLVAKRQLDLLEAQVKDALAKGAKVAVGGARPKNLLGAYYLPTVLVNIKKNMRVWTEEVFGPVLPVVKFKTEAEAVALANETRYGLTAYVFTRDKQKFLRVASKLEAGGVFINNYCQTREEPFGGYKDSGMGREHGVMGLRELCQVKVVRME